jgi:xylan 1,4-beta-xylosidase
MGQAVTAAGSEPTAVQVRVDLGRGLGAYQPIFGWFGYDEANYSTTENGRALLEELHQLTPTPVFVRVHHLLTSGDGTPELKWSSTGVYHEDAQGKPVYEWKILDGIFDAYKAAGVKPMVELGFMPKDLAATLPSKPDQPYQKHFPGDVLGGASNNPPKDYAKWEALARAVTAHLVERYGRDEVLTWYFEVWNEPDIEYWHGSVDDYLKLYDYAAAGVREALPGARVGGPATTSPRNEHARAFLKTFLDHVSTGKSAADGGAVPLDFISFHAKGQPEIHGGQVTMGISKELEDVDRGFALIASYPKLRALPVILSEADPEGCAACSSKVNPANNYRNGTLYPAYTAAVYKRMFALRDKYKIHLIGMLSWSFEFEGRDYFEGFRSLSTHGIDKPVLNVFRMFGMLEGTRVAASSSGEAPLDTMLREGVRSEPDVDAMATRKDDGASVLVWSYHDVAESGHAPTPVTVEISGLPAGVHRALLQQYRIDETHSNAYTAWKAMGSPQQPTEAQMAQLKRAGQMELLGSPGWIDTAGGNATTTIKLPAESISLLRLSW